MAKLSGKVNDIGPTLPLINDTGPTMRRVGLSGSEISLEEREIIERRKILASLAKNSGTLTFDVYPSEEEPISYHVYVEEIFVCVLAPEGFGLMWPKDSECQVLLGHETLESGIKRWIESVNITVEKIIVKVYK